MYVTSPETRLYCCLAADWPKQTHAPVGENGSFAACSLHSFNSCGAKGRNGRALCYFVSLKLLIEREETWTGIADLEGKTETKGIRYSLNQINDVCSVESIFDGLCLGLYVFVIRG